MKHRKAIVIIVLLIIVFAIFLKWKVYTPNYFWTNNLIDAIRVEDAVKVDELLKNEEMDVNKPGGSQFPAYILFPGECSRSTPFEVAMITGNWGIIEAVLDKGANADFGSDNSICRIIENGYIESRDFKRIQRLLEAGESADGEDADYDSEVPLLVISWQEADSKDRQEEITRLYKLIYNRSKVKMPKSPYDGTSPIHYAAEGHNAELIEFILQRHPEAVNFTNDLGQTPLMYALEYGEASRLMPIVKVFLNNNANLEIKDKSGKTALDYAKKNGNKEIVNLIEPVMKINK